MMTMTASLCLMATCQMMKGLWKKKYDMFTFQTLVLFLQTGVSYSLCAVRATNGTHSTFQDGGDLEKLKLRQKLKAREWDELMSTKKKMKVLEPVVKGCVWEGEGPGLQLLQPYTVCLVEPLPKADNSPTQEELSHRGQREEQCKC